MSELLNHIAIIILPLVVSNALHMVVVKFNYLKELSIPLSPKLFGNNKTWRGLFFVPMANSFLLFCFNYIFHFHLLHPFMLGCMLGFAYVFSELPNSYIKRRLGIKAGEQHEKHKIAFMLFDKMDSAFGVILTYYLLNYISVKQAILLFVISSLTHIFVSQLLYRFKIKKAF